VLVAFMPSFHTARKPRTATSVAAEVLLEKIVATRYPSIPMLNRLAALLDGVE